MNSQLLKVLSEIDLRKSQNHDAAYMQRDDMNFRLEYDPEGSLPVNPEKSDWQVTQDLLSRDYYFENRDNLSYFLINILDHAKELGHDPVLIIDYPKVIVELSTHELQEVTEVDLEFSKFIDEVYEDITFLKERF